MEAEARQARVVQREVAETLRSPTRSSHQAPHTPLSAAHSPPSSLGGLEAKKWEEWDSKQRQRMVDLQHQQQQLEQHQAQLQQQLLQQLQRQAQHVPHYPLSQQGYHQLASQQGAGIAQMLVCLQ